MSAWSSRRALQAPELRSERGSALVIVLLATVLGTLLMSLHNTTSIDLNIGANELHDRQALMLAEAGYRHAMTQMTIVGGIPQDHLDGADGVAGTRDDGLVLGDQPTPLGVGVYEVRLERDAAGRLLLIATGRALGATAELHVRFDKGRLGEEVPPYLFDNSLTLIGNPAFKGRGFTVHSNRDASVSGGTVADGPIQASGAMKVGSGATIDGEALVGSGLERYIEAHQGLDTVPVPAIEPEAYRGLADYTLSAKGEVVNRAGKVVFFSGGKTKSWSGWTFQKGTWVLQGVASGLDFASGTYFVEGDALLGASNGTEQYPLSLSVIATGSVDVGGGSLFRSHANDLLAVAGGDFRMHGSSSSFLYAGHVLAHEQLSLSGTVSLNGGIIVEDAEDHSRLVTSGPSGTVLNGTINLRFDGTLGTPGPLATGFRVLHWYEVG